MNKVIERFPTPEDFDARIEAVKREKSAARQLAMTFLWVGCANIWPVERRRLDDGRTELVLRMDRSFCDCCLHRIGVTPHNLRAHRIDQVRILHPRYVLGAVFSKKIKVCTHYHESTDDDGNGFIRYPSRQDCREDGYAFREYRGLVRDFEQCLPEFPGRLVWEFYDPDTVPTH